jgi:MurNAc alpha-1-phosphate uridylyltransferase
MRAMILAAGRGERMGHLTARVPKPLITIAGKAMIVHHLERLRSAGVTEFVINLAYRGAQIRAHLGGGEKFGVHIEYSQEPEGALETGGGIAAALALLGDGAFIVVNSDIWTDFDFATLRPPAGDAHLVLVPNPAHNPSGDFRLIGHKIVPNGGEKSTFSGIGVYLPRLFQTQRQARFALAPVLREAARGGRVSAELYEGRWIDVGTPERLKMAKQAAATR